LFCENTFAQTPNRYLPLSYTLYQKLNKEVYHQDSAFHSAIRPYYADHSALRGAVDSIHSIGVDSGRSSWLGRKLFQEHLIEVSKEDYQFYADFIPDFVVGYDKESGGSTWLNTRGYQLGLNVGNKFSFYTSGYENQGVFPQYITRF